ncbi:MAG: FtsX-like permease family protein [Gemmatimonadota bacterium]
MRKLVWRNLLRNKRRAALTVASLTLGVMLLCVLGALLQTFDPAETEASENRVVVRHAVSLQFDLPEAYWRRLEGLDHVEVVSPLSWFGGIYKDTRRENFFSQFGTDPETLLAVFDDLEIEPEAAAAWLAERRSFVAGRALADKHGWEIGDEIFLQGEIYPIDLNLVLRGIFTDSQDEAQENQIFFHRDYMEEALGNPGQVGTFWLSVDDLENVPAVIAAAEAMFENSEARVKAETEQAFVLAFVQMMGNVELLFGAIGFAVIVSVFFITANTMAMAVRERNTEISVLKTLGFGRGQVLGVLTAEAMVIGIVGGLLGVTLAATLLHLAVGALSSELMLFQTLTLRSDVALLGLAAALGIGTLSGLVPGYAMARRSVVEGLRKVA